MARVIPRAVMLVAVALGATGCSAATPSEVASSLPTSPASSAPPPAAPCIVGQWVAGAGDLQPVYDALPAWLEYPAADIAPTASVSLTFADDGSFTLEQDVPTTVEWLGRTATVSLGGTMAGAYTVSGANLSLTADRNDLTVVAADDEPASAVFAAETDDTLAEWPVAASGFSCVDDALVLDLSTEGHPAQLHLTRR